MQAALSDTRSVIAIALGLLGAAVLSYGQPWSFILVGFTALWLVLAALWHALGFHDAPLLQIGIHMNPEIDPSERDWLDWPHLAVTNVGQRRAKSTATAMNCRVSVRIDGEPRHRLRWDSEKRGGDAECSIPGPEDGQYHAATSPFLIRHRKPFAPDDLVTLAPVPRKAGELIPAIGVTFRFGGYGGFSLFGRFELQGGECYLSDEEVLTQGSPHGGGTRLSPGRHVAYVTVTYDRTGRATQRFIVDVPSRESPDRIEWHPISSKRWRAIYGSRITAESEQRSKPALTTVLGENSYG